MAARRSVTLHHHGGLFGRWSTSSRGAFTRHNSPAVAPFVGLRAGSFPSDAEQLRKQLVKPIHAAAGGSLLIRDVEEMSSAAQLTFASILSERSLGHPAGVPATIAGTTVSLLERVDCGLFPGRLFYRLNLIHLVIAPDETLTDADSPSRRRVGLRYLVKKHSHAAFSRAFLFST